jgi:hypothetical protein
MGTRVRRSIERPIRQGLSWDELWLGPDQGLICCWERGREKRVAEPELAARAEQGELLMLLWKGGVEEKLKNDRKPGTLKYLATWQGLRGEDLDIALDDERAIICTKTGQTVVFSAELPEDEP